MFGGAKAPAPLVAALAALALAAGCGSSSPSSRPNLSGDAYPGIDLAGNRQAKSRIDSGNVKRLEEAWTVPIEGSGPKGSFASTPAIAKNVVYSQDLESNVSAISLESGDVIWTRKYGSPTPGPNGVTVAEGRVYGATSSEAFALDQTTGREVWRVPLPGAVDMQPGVNDGRVYLSTIPRDLETGGAAGKVGTLYALDARTGKRLWHFDTVPRSLWGHPEINSGGGLRYPPSFDKQGNVYAGTASAGPLPGTPAFPWGSSRPGDNRYADSLVKLDPKTGGLDWYYQDVPHPIYDWDLQSSPVITRSRGRDVAVGAGRSGFVVGVDLKTGKPLWRRRSGAHDGHDQASLRAMRGEYGRIDTGQVWPGRLGGVPANMATDGKRVYVPLINHPMIVRNGHELTDGGESAGSTVGEAVGIDLETGLIVWEATFSSPTYGSLVVSNDLVFATSVDGKVHALRSRDGEEIWQATLPAGIKGGVMVSGDTLVVGAGMPAEGQDPVLVAYRLGG